MTNRCVQCGTPIEFGQFCETCAETISRELSSRPAPERPQIPPVCPSCARENQAGAAFCSYCGTALEPGPRPLLHYAGFWIRFLASIIDGVIVGILNLAVVLVFSEPLIVLLLVICISAFYTLVFWIARAATPGKMALGLRIARRDGSPVDPGTAVARYFGTFISNLTFGVGYLMIAFHPEKRGLHDLIAGTIVIKR